MSAVTIVDLNRAKQDVDHIELIATSSSATAVDRLGGEKLTLNGALTRMGYEPPVAYAGVGALTLTRGTQTVEHDGVVYAPLLAQLPLTTVNWAADESRLVVIQGITAFLLASEGGAGGVGRVGGGYLQDALSALQATTITSFVVSSGLKTGDKVFFSGRADAEDGGGGMFTYSSTSTQAADGVLVFAPTGGGRLFREGWSILGFGGRINVLWAGAVPGTDCTAAFNLAASVGPVDVPPSSLPYQVNGITVFDGLDVRGLGEGDDRPLLEVSANDGCAFLQGAANHFDLRLKNLKCSAASGVTGARFWKQTDKTKYCAYPRFENIETYKNLACSYDGLFIFAVWQGCRDGYIGTASVHQAISSRAAAYGQTNATNLNTVRDSQFFGAIGVDAAVEIAFGSMWTFENVDWEAIDTPAIKAESVRKVILKGKCWIEGVHSTEVFTLREMAGSGVGSTLDVEDSSIFVDDVDEISNTDALSRVGYRRVDFSIVASGMVLTNNPLALTRCDDLTASGVGAAGFLAGMQENRRLSGQQLFNGAASNANTSLSIVNVGGVAASAGFASGNSSISVGASWVTVFTSATNGGVALIRGVQTSSGGGGVGTPQLWQVSFVGSYTNEIADARITPFDVVVAEFQTSGDGVLQMRCTSGTCTVEASALI